MKLRMVAVGAAALVVGGVTAGIASPAYAEGGTADLAIQIDGTTIAHGADGKFGRIEVTNAGPNDATGLLLTFDISELDTTRVALALDCDPAGTDKIECILVPDGVIKDGKATTLALQVVQDATPGPAGKITVSISHDGTDPDLSDNTATAEVVISERGGVDLTVFAPDIAEEWVLNEAANEFQVAGDLLPGSETFAFVYIDNQGSEATRGVEFSLTLPEHVTFTEEFPGECTHKVGDSSTTCQLPSLALNPNVDDDFCHAPPPGVMGDGSCLFVFLPVKVADDAPESATLTGGVAEAWDMQVDFAPFAASALVHEPSEAPTEILRDVDPTDNVASFSFFTSALDDGGAGGGDGKLPTTGSPVVLITGLGAALLVVGGALYLVSRRRRVKLTATDT